jgi:hypothetical protein
MGGPSGIVGVVMGGWVGGGGRKRLDRGLEGHCIECVGGGFIKVWWLEVIPRFIGRGPLELFRCSWVCGGVCAAVRMRVCV